MLYSDYIMSCLVCDFSTSWCRTVISAESGDGGQATASLLSTKISARPDGDVSEAPLLSFSCSSHFVEYGISCDRETLPELFIVCNVLYLL